MVRAYTRRTAEQKVQGLRDRILRLEAAHEIRRELIEQLRGKLQTLMVQVAADQNVSTPPEA